MMTGRQLDALIAEKVMGWRMPSEPYQNTVAVWAFDDEGQWEEIPRFSTDLTAAWSVVGKVSEEMKLIRYYRKATDDWWYAVSFDRGCGEADTVELAICRAALAAVTQ